MRVPCSYKHAVPGVCALGTCRGTHTRAGSGAPATRSHCERRAGRQLPPSRPRARRVPGPGARAAPPRFRAAAPAAPSRPRHGPAKRRWPRAPRPAGRGGAGGAPDGFAEPQGLRRARETAFGARSTLDACLVPTRTPLSSAHASLTCSPPGRLSPAGAAHAAGSCTRHGAGACRDGPGGGPLAPGTQKFVFIYSAASDEQAVRSSEPHRARARRPAAAEGRPRSSPLGACNSWSREVRAASRCLAVRCKPQTVNC